MGKLGIIDNKSLEYISIKSIDYISMSKEVRVIPPARVTFGYKDLQLLYTFSENKKYMDSQGCLVNLLMTLPHPQHHPNTHSNDHCYNYDYICCVL